MGEFLHSQQLRFDKSHVSCGVLEAHHIPDWTGSKLAFSVANALYHKSNPRPSAFLLWSDVTEGADPRGNRLYEFLRQNKFFPNKSTAVNPKTGNKIGLYAWTIDHDPFRRWYQEELANRIEQE